MFTICEISQIVKITIIFITYKIHNNLYAAIKI